MLVGLAAVVTVAVLPDWRVRATGPRGGGGWRLVRPGVHRLPAGGGGGAVGHAVYGFGTIEWRAAGIGETMIGWLWPRASWPKSPRGCCAAASARRRCWRRADRAALGRDGRDGDLLVLLAAQPAHRASLPGLPGRRCSWPKRCPSACRRRPRRCTPPARASAWR